MSSSTPSSDAHDRISWLLHRTYLKSSTYIHLISRGEFLSGDVRVWLDRLFQEGYYSFMKVATISQTKNQLSALLDRVRHGETILIVDRDRPVARLEPVVTAEEGDEDGRLSRLERAGLIRRGGGSMGREVLKKRPPKALKGGDILEALLTDREEGR